MEQVSEAQTDDLTQTPEGATPTAEKSRLEPRRPELSQQWLSSLWKFKELSEDFSRIGELYKLEKSPGVISKRLQISGSSVQTVVCK